MEPAQNLIRALQRLLDDVRLGSQRTWRHNTRILHNVESTESLWHECGLPQCISQNDATVTTFDLPNEDLKAEVLRLIRRERKRGMVSPDSTVRPDDIVELLEPNFSSSPRECRVLELLVVDCSLLPDELSTESLSLDLTPKGRATISASGDELRTWIEPLVCDWINLLTGRPLREIREWLSDSMPEFSVNDQAELTPLPKGAKRTGRPRIRTREYRDFCLRTLDSYNAWCANVTEVKRSSCTIAL
jgi:hypothetical protein